MDTMPSTDLYIYDELKLHLCLYSFLKSTRKKHLSLRVVYVISQYIECIIDSALEVGRMEALS